MRAMKSPQKERTNFAGQCLDRGLDRLVKYCQSYIDVLLAQDQGRGPADGIRPATQNDEAAVETRHFDPISQLGIRFQSLFIGHKLDTKHQPEPANICDNVILVLQLSQTILQIRSYFTGIIDETVFE